MSRDPQLRLADIVDACTRISEYVEGLDATTFARILCENRVRPLPFSALYLKIII